MSRHFSWKNKIIFSFDESIEKCYYFFNAERIFYFDYRINNSSYCFIGKKKSTEKRRRLFDNAEIK